MITAGIGLFIIGAIFFIVGLVMQNKNKDEYDRTTTATLGEKTCNEPNQVGPSVGPSTGPSSTESSNCVTKYTFDVNGQSYEGATENDVEGSEIKIRYKSSDPSLNKIDETRGNDTAIALIYSGVGLCILGFGLGISSVLRTTTAPIKKNNNNTKR